MFPAGILYPTMKKPREQKKVGVGKRAAIKMSPRKLARQYLPLSPSIIIETHQVRSSTIASSSSAQTSSKPGPSSPISSSVYSLCTSFEEHDTDNGRTSTGMMQTPESTGARQTLHSPGQPATPVSYPIRPVQSSTPASTPQASQSSSHPSQETM